MPKIIDLNAKSKSKHAKDIVKDIKAAANVADLKKVLLKMNREK